MRIAILTSSRADFGIYLPLLNKLNEDAFFDLTIVAFGTHMSEKHGMTITEIKKNNFKNIVSILTPYQNNSPIDVSQNIAKTIGLFSIFWKENSFDLVFALGDRYEMFAAVTAATPFVINIAHIHAGETTLGAIDNIYRHSISLMCNILFVSTKQYFEKAKQINSEATVYNVGALSNDNLINVQFFSIEEFKTNFNIDLSIPTILSTIHPETVSFENNLNYTKEVLSAFSELGEKYQIVLTLPNADTMGDAMRKLIIQESLDKPYLKVVESLGMKGYLSCMKYCKMMIGNTSSGFVEAAFFPKWVLNLGDRQKGRLLTKNILNVPFIKDNILKTVKFAEQNLISEDCNIYGNGKTAEKIIEILKKNI